MCTDRNIKHLKKHIKYQISYPLTIHNFEDLRRRIGIGIGVGMYEISGHPNLTSQISLNATASFHVEAAELRKPTHLSYTVKYTHRYRTQA